MISEVIQVCTLEIRRVDLKMEKLDGEVGDEGQERWKSLVDKRGLFLAEDDDDDDDVLQVSLGELEREEDWETGAVAETVRQRS